MVLDGEPFEGTTDVFYARMRQGAVAATSQPSPSAFAEAYERSESQGAASVLSLHLDRRISGVSESAALAARDTTISVRVVSLPTVSYGVGLCVRAASAALRGGASVSEAAAEAEKVAVALDNVFVARSAPGGRVSASDEWTILRFASGEAHALSAHSSFDDAATVMGRRVLRGRPGLVAVGHAGAEVEVVGALGGRDAVDEVGAALEVERSFGPGVIGDRGGEVEEGEALLVVQRLNDVRRGLEAGGGVVLLGLLRPDRQVAHQHLGADAAQGLRDIHRSDVGRADRLVVGVVRHVRRDLNYEADKLADKAMDTRRNSIEFEPEYRLAD